MKRRVGGLALLMLSSAASAGSLTDFGVRVAPGTGSEKPSATSVQAASTQVRWTGIGPSLSSAVTIASQLGRVTSTTRSPAHNRRVGGVRNSYHLSGRAIDVVPLAGVRHADIEAALRNAGFYLIESLDEGDHSHFAFGSRPPAGLVRNAAAPRREATQWRIVSAPGPYSR